MSDRGEYGSKMKLVELRKFLFKGQRKNIIKNNAFIIEIKRLFG